MENVSTAGFVAVGTVVGAFVVYVLDRKQKEECDSIREIGINRLQRFRARKKEDDQNREREQKELELEREAKRVRKTVLQRQSRSRAKRHLTVYRDQHLDTYMLWHVEDLTCLYDLVRVQNALQCLAWHLDISYSGDIPWITDLNWRLKSWTLSKSKADKTLFWETSCLLLTQEVKLFDGELVTVLDS